MSPLSLLRRVPLVGLASFAALSLTTALPVVATTAQASSRSPSPILPTGAPTPVPAVGSAIPAPDSATPDRPAGMPAGTSAPAPAPHTGAPALAPAAEVKRACDGPVRPRWLSCLALVRTDVKPQRGIQRAVPPGLGATDLQRAYALPVTSAGAGQTVAIIDAYDNPKIEADLGVYRAQYGLPPCTTANGCFRKVDQNGGSHLPRPDSGWAEEESLDLEVASAACPKCHLLLVEANDPSVENLGRAVNTAVRLGAKYISNSFGGSEYAADSKIDATYFDHPGVAITAASGDGGYGVLYPATSSHVIAVGGTTLSRAANARGWTEEAWSGGGSGCSASHPKPFWQRNAGCSRRTIADVAAVADPATGVAIYDTYHAGGWQIVGGTSASAPLIAAVYALAGAPPAGSRPAAFPYAHAAALNDVTSGGNGSCNPSLLCTAGPGYDGPTGLGTPNGIAAFRPAAKAAPKSAPKMASRMASKTARRNGANPAANANTPAETPTRTPPWTDPVHHRRRGVRIAPMCGTALVDPPCARGDRIA